jgi:hypothetical protein
MTLDYHLHPVHHLGICAGSGAAGDYLRRKPYPRLALRRSWAICAADGSLPCMVR